MLMKKGGRDKKKNSKKIKLMKEIIRVIIKMR